jgi:single-strand DNA-binding protein
MARDLNKVMLIGRLTHDPEVRTTPNGQTVATFSVATSRQWKDAQGAPQSQTEFHNIVAWRKLAEICGQYLHKGTKVYIEGRLQTTEWAGQDNVKRYRTEIVAENMIMLDSKGAAPFGGPNTSSSNGSEATIEIPDENIDDEEIRVENIPF